MMAGTETVKRSYLSPLRKLVLFFKASRDRWKAKYHQCKRLLKKEQNQVRAVERSRAAWREKAKEATRRGKQLEGELAQVQKNRRQVSLQRPSSNGRPDIITVSG